MFSLLLIAAAAAPAVDPDSVVRCVREEITGSIARTQRVCHTVGEWKKINAAANDEAARILQPGNMNCMNSGTCK
jgi:hypothetical protein